LTAGKDRAAETAGLFRQKELSSMKKNRFLDKTKTRAFFFGMLAIMLAVGLILTGCGDSKTGDPGSPGDGRIPAELVAVWYSDEATQYECFEIRSNGKAFVFGDKELELDVTVSGENITISISGPAAMTLFKLKSYKVEGNQLKGIEITQSGENEATYYKK
jgi:hypothetical protein